MYDLPAPQSFTNIRRGLDLADYNPEYSYSYSSTDFEGKNNDRVKTVTVVKNLMQSHGQKIKNIENHMVINMPTPATAKTEVKETIEYWPQKNTDTKIIRLPHLNKDKGKENFNGEFHFEYEEPSEMKQTPEEFVLANQDNMYKYSFPDKMKDDLKQSIQHPIPKQQDKQKAKDTPFWHDFKFDFNEPAKKEKTQTPIKPEDPFKFEWNDFPFNFEPVTKKAAQQDSHITWSDFTDFIKTTPIPPKNKITEKGTKQKDEPKKTFDNDYPRFIFPIFTNFTDPQSPFEYSLEQYYGGATANKQKPETAQYPTSNQYSSGGDYNFDFSSSKLPAYNQNQADNPITNFDLNFKDFPNYESANPYKYLQTDDEYDEQLSQTGPITFPPFMGSDKNKTGINITSTFKFLKENNITIKPIVIKMSEQTNSNVSGFLSSPMSYKTNNNNDQQLSGYNNTNYLSPSELPIPYFPYENNPTLSRLAAAVALGNIAHIKELAEKLQDDSQSSPGRSNKRKNISTISSKKSSKIEASTVEPYVAPKLRTPKIPVKTSTTTPIKKTTTITTTLTTSTTTPSTTNSTPISTATIKSDNDESTEADIDTISSSSSTTTVEPYIAPKIRNRVIRRKLKINLNRDDIPE